MSDLKKLDQSITDMGITYPTWLFDPDDAARPRKLADIPSDSKRAQLRGWNRWYWEYGMNVDKGTNTKKQSSAKEVVNRLRYDDDADDYELVLEGNTRADLSARGQIESIERKWDGLTVWDSKIKAHQLDEAVDGLAILVNSTEDLVKKAGINFGPNGQPQKAQFDFEDGGVGKGLVFNGRFHGQTRGIIPSADFEYNNQFLVGTEYQDLSKDEKIKYFKGLK